MSDRSAWLEDLAVSCTSTLSVLNRKAARTKQISDGDQIMSEICMGYLYLLYVANSEGVLDLPESIGNSLNITIH